MDNLKGRVALITGCAAKHSMGRAVAMQLAKEGADVVLADKFMVPPTIREEDADWQGMKQISADIEKLGCKALAIEADLGETNDCLGIVKKTMESFGRIDYFVNCAGMRGPSAPITEYSIDAFNLIMNVNINGVFVLSQAIAKEMIKEPEGRKIVLFASQAGIEAMPGGVAYSVSKHAVLGFMKCLALELAPYGINVNAISPMAFDTNFRDGAVADAAKQRGVSIKEAMNGPVAGAPQGTKGDGPVIPIGRHGNPQDAADMVSFLLSDQSSYVTAQNILMNGGLRSL